MNVISRYYFFTEPPYHDLKLIDSSKVGLEIYLNSIFENYASAIIGLSENSNKWDLTGEFTVHIENYLNEIKSHEIIRIESFKSDIERLVRFKDEIKKYPDEILERMIKDISVDGKDKETPIYNEDGTFDPTKQRQVLYDKLDKRIKEYKEVIVKVENSILAKGAIAPSIGNILIPLS